MSDIIFIRDEKEYFEFRKTHTTFERRTKVNFKCSICEQICLKRFCSLKIPFICVGCNISNTQKSAEIKEKKRNTCLKKYGVEHHSKSKLIKDKKKETYIKHYGVDHVAKSSYWKESIKKTCLEKYGVDCVFKDEEIKNKIKQTCLEKYGVEHPLQNEDIMSKFKNTSLDKYGTEIPVVSKIIREKIHKTVMDKYGVDYITQTDDFSKYRHNKIEYDGIKFDSKLERDFYKKCKALGLDIKYQPCVFEYTDSFNRKHSYYPDFEVNGKLYELKGDHLWKDGHLWNPYRKDIDETTLALIDARDIAKTNCMYDNDVIVILESQLDCFEI